MLFSSFTRFIRLVGSIRLRAGGNSVLMIFLLSMYSLAAGFFLFNVLTLGILFLQVVLNVINPGWVIGSPDASWIFYLAIAFDTLFLNLVSSQQLIHAGTWREFPIVLYFSVVTGLFVWLLASVFVWFWNGAHFARLSPPDIWWTTGIGGVLYLLPMVIILFFNN